MFSFQDGKRSTVVTQKAGTRPREIYQHILIPFIQIIKSGIINNTPPALFGIIFIFYAFNHTNNTVGIDYMTTMYLGTRVCNNYDLIKHFKMNRKELDSEKVLFIIKGIVIHARKGNTTNGNFL